MIGGKTIASIPPYVDHRLRAPILFGGILIVARPGDPRRPAIRGRSTSTTARASRPRSSASSCAAKSATSPRSRALLRGHNAKEVKPCRSGSLIVRLMAALAARRRRPSPAAGSRLGRVVSADEAAARGAGVRVARHGRGEPARGLHAARRHRSDRLGRRRRSPRRCRSKRRKRSSIRASRRSSPLANGKVIFDVTARPATARRAAATGPVAAPNGPIAGVLPIGPGPMRLQSRDRPHRRPHLHDDLARPRPHAELQADRARRIAGTSSTTSAT